MPHSRKCVGWATLLVWILLGIKSISNAQVVQDTTLPDASVVTQQNNGTFIITGGTRRGGNLFHSFRAFSPGRDTVSFQGVDPAIANVLSRVTGSSRSYIDGILEMRQTDGQISPANLFLINPNGILFGRNASLNIGGSFLATTADSVLFKNSIAFSATDPQAPPIITVSAPIGLQFGDRPGSIINQSTVALQDNAGAPIQSEINGERQPIQGLQVLPGHTIALVGGDLLLRGGGLFAAGGRIELGSLAQPGVVNLIPTETGWRLDYPTALRFGNIHLSQQAVVDTSGLQAINPNGAGAIQVRGGRIRLTNGSQIRSLTEGEQPGQAIAVHASDSILLVGVRIIGESSFNSGLLTETTGNGAAGTIRVTTRRLSLLDGATIYSTTFGAGRSGNLLFNIADLARLDGGSFDPQDPQAPYLSSIEISSLATGNNGRLMLSARRLVVQDGAKIGSITSGTGLGGNIRIQSSDSIDVIGGSPIPRIQALSSLIYNQTESADTNAHAGVLRIETNQLRVLAGQINATTFGASNAGALVIRANDINLTGSAPNPNDNRNGTRPFPGGLFAGTGENSMGNGGRLRIETQRLRLAEGGVLQTTTLGSGNAGSMVIHADESIDVVGIGAGNSPIPFGIDALSGANIDGTFREATGRAGNIDIHTRILRIQNAGAVATRSINTTDEAKGAGNVLIQANQIFLNTGGQINAATASGNGGNLLLQGTNAIVLQNNSQISTSAGQGRARGVGGNITINAPDGLIVASPFGNSDISANSFRDRGGRIDINAGIFGLVSRSRQEIQALQGTRNLAQFDPQQLTTSDITTISQTNPALSGSILITNPDVDPTNGLVELPTNLVDRAQEITQTCSRRNRANEFVVSGRGGLPPSPDDLLRSPATLSPEWVILNSEPQNPPQAQRNQPSEESPITSSEHDSASVPSNSLLEAGGWIRDTNGNIKLVAQSSATPLENPSCATE